MERAEDIQLKILYLKKLLLESNFFMQEQFIYMIPDLKAYYYCELPNIRCMVKESIRDPRDPCILF